MKALDGAKNSYDRLKNVIIKLKSSYDKKEENNNYEERFLIAINDDLNMPSALSVLWEVLRNNKLGDKQKLELVIKFDKVFGLGIKEMEEEKIDIPEEVQKLVDAREEARKNKDWAKADELRDKIQEAGYILKDGKDGIKVKKS